MRSCEPLNARVAAAGEPGRATGVRPPSSRPIAVAGAAVKATIIAVAIVANTPRSPCIRAQATVRPGPKAGGLE